MGGGSSNKWGQSALPRLEYYVALTDMTNIGGSSGPPVPPPPDSCITELWTLTNTNLLDGTHSLSDTETCTIKEKEQILTYAMASPGLNPRFYSNWQRFGLIKD